MSELKLPEFEFIREAAAWVRENGHMPLTNGTFKGLLADIMRRPIRDEEFIRVKVLSAPPAYSLEGFITVEEKAELDIICAQYEELAQDVSFTINERGIYVRFTPPPHPRDVLDIFSDM